MCKAKKDIESFHPEDKHLKSITYQINHTFAKSSNSNQNSEDIEEILVNDGKTELELETDSLVDDLSNTETPEDGQQIGCVELPKSDSVWNEAILATVMYVDSDDIGDSGTVNIWFGDDDDLTELHEFESDTVLIDDSTCGLYIYIF